MGAALRLFHQAAVGQAFLPEVNYPGLLQTTFNRNARRYAAAIDRHTTSADVPLWARQMEIFILEDMNELEAARVMLGGLLEQGEIRDPNERRFLQQRLRELEERVK